jgi:hypothetical protein
MTLPYLTPSIHEINKFHVKNVGSLTVYQVLKTLATGVAYFKEQY